MKALSGNRAVIAAAGAAAIGTLAISRWPFPDQTALLGFIRFNAPWLFYGIKFSYLLMFFSTPWIALSVLLSFTYIFGQAARKGGAQAKLPPYPEASGRK